MTKKLKWILAISLYLFVSQNSGWAEDAWQGLDEPLDESKLLEDSGEPDLSPLSDENAPQPSSSSASKKTEPTSPPPSGDQILSPEEKVQQEYDAYTQKKQSAQEEDRLRQRVFHEGSKNSIGLNFGIDDLNHNVYVPGTINKRSPGTRSFGLAYERAVYAKRRVGRFIIGGHVHMIGHKDMQQAFPDFAAVGPRLTYEALFSLGQIFVPFGFYGYEHVFNRMKSSNAAFNGDFNTSVYGGGILVNLNRLDSHTGTKALVDTGIRKFNLVLGYQRRAGNTSDRSSNSYNVGLKFEY